MMSIEFILHFVTINLDISSIHNDDSVSLILNIHFKCWFVFASELESYLLDHATKNDALSVINVPSDAVVSN